MKTIVQIGERKLDANQLRNLLNNNIFREMEYELVESIVEAFQHWSDEGQKLIYSEEGNFFHCISYHPAPLMIAEDEDPFQKWEEIHHDNEFLSSYLYIIDTV